MLQDDRFRILDRLGSGGMADVYRAFDVRKLRFVALKISRKLTQPDEPHPMQPEYDTQRRFDHPNIPRVLELSRARRGPLRSGRPYLVLDLVDGESIERLFRGKAVDPAPLRSICRQLLEALSHVHAHRLVHRDIKPTNLLLESSRDGGPALRLIDFGLTVTRGHENRAGVVSGSLPYVSPEALCGAPVDERSDLYSSGILIYRLATGDRPVAEDAEGWVRWHLNGAPLEWVAPSPEVEPIVRLVRRLTERDPARRPATAEQALAELDASGARRLPFEAESVAS